MPLFPRRILPLLLLASALMVLPFVFPGKYQLAILILVGLNAVVCIGLNLLVGTAGQISLGHAAFFGIGAYASAVLVGDCGLHPVAAMVIGALIACAISGAIGWPILHLKGHYLAMATLGVGLVVNHILVHESWLTGGPDGRPVAPFVVAGRSVQTEAGWYWVVAGTLFVAVWIAENLSSSPWGRSLRAIQASEPAAAASGIDVHRAKVTIFMASAALASIAGSLYAHAFAFITPDQAGFLHSVELVVMIVIGGLGSVYGSVIGAALIVVLPHVLTSLQHYEHLVFGVLLIAVAYSLRRGIVPSLAALLTGRRQ